MTNKEKDAVWRSLPENFKEWIKSQYKRGVSPGDFRFEKDSQRLYVEAQGGINMLEFLFGHHNLTAEEKKEPTPEGNTVEIASDESPHKAVVWSKPSHKLVLDWLPYRMELAKEITPKVISALRDAYEQGYVDCDTKDMKAESESEFFNNDKTE